MSTILKLLLWLIGLILVLVILSFAAFYFSVDRETSSQNTALTPTYLVGLLQAKSAGNDEEALSQYQAIVGNPQTTAEQKALAEINVSGIGFSIYGTTQAELQDVDGMQSIVTDPTISASTRAIAMSVLGNAYKSSGQNTTVLAEVFKETPFSSYRVASSAQISSMRLEEESYLMAPTSVAAIHVAEIASGLYFSNPAQNATTTAAYATLAEQYLSDATVAVGTETQAPGYMYSTAYMIYRAGQATVAGYLAIEVGGSYESGYRQVFDTFFTFAQAQQNTQALDEILNVRYQYARVLVADKDVATEKIQLDQLAQELNGLTDPSAHPFVVFLQNAHSNPSGPSWLAIENMSAVSPNFQAAVTKLVSPTQ